MRAARGGKTVVTPRLRAAALAVALGALTGCGPKPFVTLPSGSGVPTTLESSGAATAFASCSQLHSLTAEVGISGRAGRQRLRGRLIAGLVRPESVRLEAVAPFGPPVFILVSSPGDTTLLLPRDHRVLRGRAPAEILDALAGVSLTPGALLARLGGCPSFEAPAGDVRAHGDRWISIAAPELTVWLRRSQDDGTGGSWRIAAVTEPRLRTEFERTDAGEVRRVHLVREGSSDTERGVDLTLTLSQVETNVPVPAEAFALTVPDDAAPITLDELRQSGPMRDEAPRSGTW